MNSGRIVERRDQVLIGFLSLAATALSTWAIRWWSTNGPFFNERVMAYPLLLATRDDERLRALVVTSAVALREGVPRRHRRLAFTGTTFTTTVRVIHRVHCHTANGRADTLPTDRTGLAVLAQLMLFVADLADRGAAVDVDTTHLTRAHAQLSVDAFASHQHHRGTGRT